MVEEKGLDVEAADRIGEYVRLNGKLYNESFNPSNVEATFVESTWMRRFLKTI